MGGNIQGSLWQVAVEKSREAVLAFLGSTSVGCISVRRKVPEEAEDTTGISSGDEREEGEEGEEGGPGPPGM